MNLIITCARHLESEASNELRAIFAEFGDENLDVTKTSMSGILTAKTKLDPLEAIRKIREKIVEEPWSIRYCLRIIPIEQVVETIPKKISSTAISLMKRINEKDTYRITIEKRNSKISSSELISEIAKNIKNKVSLETPNWVVLIEILGPKTGIAVLKNNDIFSLEISKRESLK
ncbi:MAG TPA: THUMP domain-containing protein [Nitrosopumilaceae archaeon]|nr:THUMP domain-containing protein [Nitrosopumilaceae archaeon]